MSKEIKEHLDKAFYWLDKIPVSGAFVDIMAMARSELRAAQAMCEENQCGEKE